MSIVPSTPTTPTNETPTEQTSRWSTRGTATEDISAGMHLVIEINEQGHLLVRKWRESDGPPNHPG